VPRAADDSDRATELAPDPSVVADAVTRLLDEAALTGSLLVLAGADLATAELGRLNRAALPVIAIGARGWDPAWTTVLPTVVAAPKLTVAQRQALWESMLPDQQVPREAVALRLTPEQIRQVAVAARAAAVEEGLADPELSHLRAAARRICRGQHATESGVTIDDLILPEHIRREVVRLLDWTRYRDEVAELGPLHGKGKGTGICALFAGSPGTGKTLAAHVVADTLGMDLMQVDLSSVLSKYIGESERNLERLFADAEATNAVLFFDEADALFGSRSEIKDAHDRYANQEISYLLQRMESFDGVTILATNLRGNLDPAFARRLHFVITFPDPDAATRAELWRHHLAAAGEVDAEDPIDPVELGAAMELCGGDIRNVVLSAVYDAVAKGEPLGLRHVADALSREFVKLGRRMPTVRWMADAAASPRRRAGTSASV
jgi:AAA+ superfamily predicted ATPase